MQQSMESQKVGQNLEMEQQQQSREKVSLHWLEGKNKDSCYNRVIYIYTFFLDGLVGSPCSPRDSQESSPTPQFKNINSLVLSFLFFFFFHLFFISWRLITLQYCSGFCHTLT